MRCRVPPTRQARGRNRTLPSFAFSRTEGVLGPRAHQKIDVTCRPMMSGPQSFTIIVRDQTNGFEQTLTLSFTSSQLRYLRFPTLEEYAGGRMAFVLLLLRVCSHWRTAHSSSLFYRFATCAARLIVVLTWATATLCHVRSRQAAGCVSTCPRAHVC